MTAFSSALRLQPLQPPSPPIPPALEGYLKKLKRKTSILSGGYNTRWFFVDTKRLEFGYSKTKATNASRSSIYLNDITAVVQFDDLKFQVESKTRNFFLCGESKACTSCWVQSLEEYRRNFIDYIKARAVWEAGNASLRMESDAACQATKDGITNQGIKNPGFIGTITSQDCDDQSEHRIPIESIKGGSKQFQTQDEDHPGPQSRMDQRKRPMNAWD